VRKLAEIQPTTILDGSEREKLKCLTGWWAVMDSNRAPMTPEDDAYRTRNAPHTRAESWLG
jgi:hypothetical protein